MYPLPLRIVSLVIIPFIPVSIKLANLHLWCPSHNCTAPTSLLGCGNQNIKDSWPNDLTSLFPRYVSSQHNCGKYQIFLVIRSSFTLPLLPVLTRQACPKRARTAVSLLSVQTPRVRGSWRRDKLELNWLFKCRGAAALDLLFWRLRLPKPPHKKILSSLMSVSIYTSFCVNGYSVLSGLISPTVKRNHSQSQVNEPPYPRFGFTHLHNK